MSVEDADFRFLSLDDVGFCDFLLDISGAAGLLGVVDDEVMERVTRIFVYPGGIRKGIARIKLMLKRCVLGSSKCGGVDERKKEDVVGLCLKGYPDNDVITS